MEELRPSLTLYAYNILGSYEEAKDIVQDVYLKFSLVDRQKVNDLKSYLIRMVVNLSIDRKRKLKKQLAHYPGPWLPEPLATDDPHFYLYRRQILSYSMLVLLEKLDSKQRAVFILKEAFDYGHEEIGALLGISVENSRKILSRAKSELRSGLKATPHDGQMQILDRYLQVMEAGDMQELEEMLSRDVTVTSDGGGKATAFRNVIRTVKSVSSLLSGLYRKIYSKVHVEHIRVNHLPAICYYEDGHIVTCQIFSLDGNQIQNIFFIRNPEKLQFLQRQSHNSVTFSPDHSS